MTESIAQKFPFIAPLLPMGSLKTNPKLGFKRWFAWVTFLLIAMGFFLKYKNYQDDYWKGTSSRTGG